MYLTIVIPIKNQIRGCESKFDAFSKHLNAYLQSPYPNNDNPKLNRISDFRYEE